MEWEYEWEAFWGNFQPMVIVTGGMENIGSAYAEEFELECRLLADDKSIIDSRKRVLRQIEEHEEKLFYYKFRTNEEETKSVNEVEFEGSFPK